MIKTWLCDSLQRIFPSSNPPAGRLALDAARGERFSFQLALRTDERRPLTVAVQAPDGISLRVRRVGYVPVMAHSFDTQPAEVDGYEHLPGLAPDPLLDAAEPLIHPPLSATAYWISGQVAPDCRPGPKPVRVQIRSEKEREPLAELTALIRINPLVLKPRRDFDVTHWFYADALCDWYRVEPWTEPFWQIVQPYFRNLADHGQNVVYVPFITPPINGVRRPHQLLGVRRQKKARYQFDWAKVARWIRAARAGGLEKFEWAHLFTQWGAAQAPRIYQGPADREQPLWHPDTPALSPVYRAFLAQLMPQLDAFLRRERIRDRSFFHISDEPGLKHRDHYRALRTLLRELAPWMKIMDALSDKEFALEGLVDLPVAYIGMIKHFVDAGIPCWAYFCCGPKGRFLNRFLETPLAKIRMAGWLFYRFGHLGFLHWGYNYWYRKLTRELVNPFLEQDAGEWPMWLAGDPFVVYPGPQGPLDSIRWEVFAESLQDYRLLQTAEIAPESLSRDLIDYGTFPKSAAWIRRRRRKILGARA